MVAWFFRNSWNLCACSNPLNFRRVFVILFVCLQLQYCQDTSQLKKEAHSKEVPKLEELDLKLEELNHDYSTNHNQNSLVYHKISNFRKAKKLLTKIYTDRQKDFYCNCNFLRSKKEGYTVSQIQKDCGLKARLNQERAFRLEWEHIMPAHTFGQNLSCWKQAVCEKNGISFKGRKCCRRIDPLFQQMESDLHNIHPSPGEINADRSSFPYGIVVGEARKYGSCDFEVDFHNKLAEPREEIRGDIARTYFYMNYRYQIQIDPKQWKLFQSWAEEDPPDEWEMERNNRIKKIQGNSNPFIDR